MEIKVQLSMQNENNRYSTNNQSIAPRVRQIVETKWQEKLHQIHRKNIANIKGVVDLSPPKSYKAKPRDLDNSGNIISKKYRMLEDKYTEIERSNHRLFGKLSQLLDKSNKSKFLPAPQYK